MTGMRRIWGEDQINKLRNKFFDFTVPPTTPVLMHALCFRGEVVGYVATEDHHVVGGPHIYVKPAYRTKYGLTAIGKIFKDLYCPQMKARGMFALTTNCDQDDRGTVNFLGKIGFTLKNITVAEVLL